MSFSSGLGERSEVTYSNCTTEENTVSTALTGSATGCVELWHPFGTEEHVDSEYWGQDIYAFMEADFIQNSVVTFIYICKLLSLVYHSATLLNLSSVMLKLPGVS